MKLKTIQQKNKSNDGVRVDGWVKTGSSISHFYDNLIAKLIVWGVSREEAISKGKRCIIEFYYFCVFRIFIRYI